MSPFADWVLHPAFHWIFFVVNLVGVSVSSWSLAILIGDAHARQQLGRNGPVAYATTISLRQEAHRLVTQALFVGIAIVRIAGNDALRLTTLEVQLILVSMFSATMLQSLLLLWASVYGRWARVQLLHMQHSDLQRRATDRVEVGADTNA